MGLLTILKKVKEEEREIRILVLGLDNAGKTTIVRRLCDKPIDDVEPTLGFSIQTLEYELCDDFDDDEGVGGDDASGLGDDDDDGAAAASSSASPTMTTTTTYQLHLWDIGGQSTIRAYWRNYFEKTDGIVWVVDAGDRSRMGLVRDELALVLRQERLEGASLLVLANKSDLDGALGPAAIATALELRRQTRAARRGRPRSDDDVGDDDGDDDERGAPPTSGGHESRHWTIRASSAVTGEGLADSIDWLVRDITDRIYFAA
mmetsp:Transcript_25869/g.60684  ORF Transcript_25869/g.60684 Transcript_25869/m.60684 type:complete len:261 (-) Transcript_25869:437-1219(-)